jgi:nucleotide-binding universal stress UspA family protein
MAVYDSRVAVHTGWNAPRVREELERNALVALERARRKSPRDPMRVSLRDGVPALELLREQGRIAATLIAVGSHGHGRPGQIPLGGMLSELLLRAPCSLLVARPVRVWREFPGSIVAAVDGSLQGDRALAEASELEARFGARLRIHRLPVLEALDTLLATAAGADLVVLGCAEPRRATTLRTLSRKLVRGAASSVLVVR